MSTPDTHEPRLTTRERLFVKLAPWLTYCAIMLVVMVLE
jgi:hypothetical protein